MKNFMKILSLLAVVALITAPAMAKEEPPAPTKMKKLSFPKFKEFDTKSGLQVVVVEHHEQPIATIYVAVKTGATADPEGKVGLSGFVGELLNKGTNSRNSEELATWIESYGGSFNASAGEDVTSLSVSILSEYLDVAWEYLAEVVMNPTFPEDELEEARKRIKTGLEFELSDAGAMADRHFKSVIYGDHPYANAATVETVEAVTRDDIVDFHKTNFVANNALLFVVGDVNPKEVKKAVDKHFGKWAAGEPTTVAYPEAPERTAKNISLYHRPGAVQTNLYVGHIGLETKDEDWPAVTVANRILGGGATGRLFMNLREEKGWTYGAYSNFTKSQDRGYFRATANVRTEVTDSALVELVGEITRIVDEPVEEHELSNAKSYLIGNFPTTIETPNQIAGQIATAKLLGLGKKQLESYREKIADVEVEDVQMAMKKHVMPDRLALVLVGDATEVYDKVEPIASIALYDIEGAPLEKDELLIKESDYDFDTAALRDMSATYQVMMQESMNLGDLNVELTRAGEDFNVSSSLTGMISLSEEMAFGTNNFEPKSYKFSMQAGPTAMSADIAIAGNKATGMVNGQDGEKEIDTDLVKGTLLGNSIEYVIATLPLADTKKFEFPVIDTQTGSLQSIKIEVLGEEELMVPAGSYATYKIKVKRPEGEVIYFVTKDTPHMYVKQDIPAQGLSIQLKSVKK